MTQPHFDLLGKRFSRLLVIARAPAQGSGGARWKCACDCGNRTITASVRLRNGTAKSCGCLNREALAEARRARRGAGWAPNGQKTPTYRVWQNMKTRCLNPRSQDYANYGGRGIQVCACWATSFEAFLADMGEKPDGKSIDRFPDMNGNYEPGNCRWASAKEQARNTRRVKLTEPVRAEIDLRLASGEIQSDVGATYGVTQAAISSYVCGRTWQEDVA